MRSTPRPRHHLGPVAFAAARPLLRFSITRDAYVLRVVGGRWGPVVRRGPAPEPVVVSAPPNATPTVADGANAGDDASRAGADEDSGRSAA